MDDMPQGAFICTYVGKLYGTEEGNKQGIAFGDNYFADLDMLEVVEGRKDGSESDGTDIEDEEEDNSKETSKLEDNVEVIKHKSVRKYYGGEEGIYILDTMTQGNIARYLNHSCDPNVFVQNVFIDTHDLRFPTSASSLHSPPPCTQRGWRGAGGGWRSIN